MKIKKLALICACAAITCTTFVACGKSKATEETTAAATEATTEDATTADALEKPASYGDVTLGEYKGVDVSVDDTAVTDDEVDAQIKNILSGNPTFTDVTDRAAAEGDTVNIDYDGKIDGKTFDGGSSTGYDLKLGSKSFIDGFEDGLIGAKVGDTKDLSLKFPTTYSSADLAGKDVVFTVKVNSIKIEQEAVLDDAWVTTYTKGASTTVEQFKASTKADLIASNEKNSTQKAQYAALQKAMDNATFEINPDATAYEYQQQIAYYTSMAQSYGTDFDSLVGMYGMTTDAFKTQLKSYAEDIVKQQLTVDAVVKAEDMKIEDADYTYLTDMYGSDKDTLIKNYGQDIVDQNAMMYKVVNFLLTNDNQTIVETTAEPEVETEAASTVTGESETETSAAN